MTRYFQDLLIQSWLKHKTSTYNMTQHPKQSFSWDPSPFWPPEQVGLLFSLHSLEVFSSSVHGPKGPISWSTLTAPLPVLAVIPKSACNSTAKQLFVLTSFLIPGLFPCFNLSYSLIQHRVPLLMARELSGQSSERHNRRHRPAALDVIPPPQPGPARKTWPPHPTHWWALRVHQYNSLRELNSFISVWGFS